MKNFSSPEITFARAPCPADILEPIIKHFKTNAATPASCCLKFIPFKGRGEKMSQMFPYLVKDAYRYQVTEKHVEQPVIGWYIAVNALYHSSVVAGCLKRYH